LAKAGMVNHWLFSYPIGMGMVKEFVP
jgi:hypothetical protein